MKRSFAFFDFDGTLTRIDSVLPFLRYCMHSNWNFYRKLLPLLPQLGGYLSGIISNTQVKEALFTQYLVHWHTQEIEHAAHQFATHILPSLLFNVGMQKLFKHQKNGDFCVLVSASPEFYLLPWAQSQGINAVIATKMQFINNKLTGKITGLNCYGIHKVELIEAHFGKDCWANSVAYSDSRVDLPMLQRVQSGFLLNKYKTDFLPILF